MCVVTRTLCAKNVLQSLSHLRGYGCIPPPPVVWQTAALKDDISTVLASLTAWTKSRTKQAEVCVPA